MKRYLLFAGSFYYPGGGWNDFVGDFDFIESALTEIPNQNCDWWQIVDSKTKKIFKNNS